MLRERCFTATTTKKQIQPNQPSLPIENVSETSVQVGSSTEGDSNSSSSVVENPVPSDGGEAAKQGIYHFSCGCQNNTCLCCDSSKLPHDHLLQSLLYWQENLHNYNL